MLLSPVDYQQFAEATGTEYPRTDAQKAALQPLVSQWKAENQAQFAENRGPNALSIGIGLLGAAGLGATGLALFNRFRRSGLDDATAARLARETEAQQPSGTQAPPPTVQTPDQPLQGPNPVAVVRDRDGSIRYQTGFLAPGSIRGTAESRRRGEYSPNSLYNSDTWGPRLRAATTPEAQQALVNEAHAIDPALGQRLADEINARGSSTAGPVRVVNTEAQLPAAAGVPEGVAYYVRENRALLAPRRTGGSAEWVAADAPGVAARLASTGNDAYGAALPSDFPSESPLNQPEKKARAMAQPGYYLPDESRSALITTTPDALTPQARADGFTVDSLSPGEPSLLLDPNGNPVTFGQRDAARLLNRPIALSDLVAAADYADGYLAEAGDSDRDRLRLFLERENEVTRGGLETPPATSADPRALRLKESFGWDLIPAQERVMADGRVVMELPRWEERPYEGGVYIGKTVGELPRGDAGDSFIQSEPSGSLVRAADAYLLQDSRTPEALNAIAQRYNVPPVEIEAAARRLAGADPLRQPSGYSAPPASRVGGHTNEDWLTQVLSAMQVTPRPPEVDTTAALTSDNPGVRARAAQGWLNANSEITEALSSTLSGIPAAERLSIVQEGLGNAAVDFKRAVDWANANNPDLAARLTGGAGTPSFDQFAKSYVRRFALGAAAELKNAGGGRAAVINLPADVSELIGTQAVSMNTTPDAIINQTVAGSKTPIDALWKLDATLSAAASNNLNEPYTVGSKLAEQFWDAATPGDGTNVGALKQRLGATSQDSYASRDPLAANTSRLPIAIKFGSRIMGADSGGLLNPDRASQDAIIQNVVAGDVSSTVDPALATMQRSRPARRSALEMEMAQLGAAGPRQFPINNVLKNQAASIASDLQRIDSQLKAGQITPDNAALQKQNLRDSLTQIADTQINQLDALRLEGEQLLSRANQLTVNADGTPAATGGRGYVLDLNPRSGTVQALPDSYQEIASLDALNARTADGSDGREFLDLATRQDLTRDSSIAPAAPEVNPTASNIAADATLRDYGHGTGNARVYLRGAGSRSLAGDAGALDQAVAKLRSQGYGPGYGTEPGTSLVTPELALRVARANLDRLNTLPAAAAPAGMNTQPAPAEIDRARAQHLADYITRVATPSFDAAGRQIAGWTGGDSFSGGARVAGRQSANLGPYNPPSDAILRRIAARR